MARNALLVEITPEDEAWGVSQDRWNCAVVRAVQRKFPQALYVTADAKSIGLTMPDEGEDGIRYTFDPPPQGLLEVFDREHRVPDEYRSFRVVARESRPMQHITRETRKKAAKNRTQAKPRRNPRSTGVVTRQTNRFLDAEAGE